MAVPSRAFPVCGYHSGMMLTLWLAAQASLPESCVLTGLCGVPRIPPPVASGVFFLAVGLIAVGTVGYRRRREGR